MAKAGFRHFTVDVEPKTMLPGSEEYEERYSTWMTGYLDPDGPLADRIRRALHAGGWTIAMLAEARAELEVWHSSRASIYVVAGAFFGVGIV
jgi:hypothetical protein